MPSGGYRKNAPLFKSTWQHKETKVVRVPVVFADIVLKIARKLDAGESLEEVEELVEKNLFLQREIAGLSQADLEKVHELIVELKLKPHQRPQTSSSEAEKQAARDRFESHFGEIQGNPTGANNEAIDTDLVREYASNHEETNQ